ncbi:hypothetical protein [Vibrio rotiferianus]|uniref:hypothetical protein n=1 Tax=Vibrio rotiferianus TaxID=190895 RepID=UPI0024917728|nr:hypothetical protein [Vibrio rotiferianus]
MNKKHLAFPFILAFISGCNSQTSPSQELDDAVLPPPSKYCKVTNVDSLVCDGGYSWWTEPLLDITDGKIALTGVGVEEGKSIQWITLFDTKKRTLYTYEYPRYYASDEHNTPSVIHHDGYWWSAVTGHSELSSSKGNIVTLYKFDQSLTIVDQIEFTLPNAASYSQLMVVDGLLVIGTRDRDRGWGLLSTKTGEWYRFGTHGLNYQLMNAQSPNVGSTSSYHPKHTYQAIGSRVLELDQEGRLNRLVEKNEVVSTSEAARLLSRVRDEKGTGCALYSELNADNSWSLFIASIESDYIQNTQFLGTFWGMLGEKTNPSFNGKYILGGSLVDCQTAIVASKQEEQYTLTLESLTEDSIVLYESERELYRPLVENGYVMFNEASFWNSYSDYSARQYVLPLLK